MSRRNGYCSLSLLRAARVRRTRVVGSGNPRRWRNEQRDQPARWTWNAQRRGWSSMTDMRSTGADAAGARLTATELSAIAAYAAKAVWPAGFTLYQRGAPADGVFVVLSGRVVLRSRVKAGR